MRDHHTESADLNTPAKFHQRQPGRGWLVSDILRTAWGATIPIRAGWKRLGLSPIKLLDDEPHLPPASKAEWYSALRNCNVYLEYGSGGSTLAALRTAAVVVSVETDKRYVRAVRDRVTHDRRCRGELIDLYADIGWTLHFGEPAFKHVTGRRRNRWLRYPYVPWRALQDRGLVPDVIFIDGRFRVASVLVSLLHLPKSSDCRILVDDFVARKSIYDAILEFAEDVVVLDQMIIFKKSTRLDENRCVEVLRDFELDYR